MSEVYNCSRCGERRVLDAHTASTWQQWQCSGCGSWEPRQPRATSDLHSAQADPPEPLHDDVQHSITTLHLTLAERIRVLLGANPMVRTEVPVTVEHDVGIVWGEVAVHASVGSVPWLRRRVWATMHARRSDNE